MSRWTPRGYKDNSGSLSTGTAPRESSSPWLHRRSRTLALIGLAVLTLIYYTSTKRHDTATDSIKWSKYAYSQYATDSATVCNAVMVFEALHRLGSRAERVLLYPKEWDTTVESVVDRDSQLLNLARLKYNVKLHPIQLLGVNGDGVPGTFGAYSSCLCLAALPVEIATDHSENRVLRSQLQTTHSRRGILP